jgi:hypothetical protein
MRSRFSTNIVLFVGFVWLSASLTGCMDRAGPGRPATEPALSPSESRSGDQAGCVPTFPDQNGWYGADAAYSVPLPIDNGLSSLWLFGDTFVERPGSPEGRAYPFIHNSIGISTCRTGGDWQLEMFWRHEQQASDDPRAAKTQPRAFFVPSADSVWIRDARRTSNSSPYYWPFDGFIAHDTLFIGLLRVVESPPRGPFNLPFRLAGTDLARIENFRAPPEDWKIRISTLSNNILAFPGSAFVKTDRHVYAFAFFDRGDGRSPRMLSRLDLDSLIEWQPDLSGKFETWTNDSSWIDGFTPEEAMTVMDDDASEMSVHFDAASKNWLAVYIDPVRDRFGDGQGIVRMRSAKELTGPWSEPRRLLSIPETTTDPVDENLFCYAGKAHPQFASRGKILITYVCNLFAASARDHDPDLDTNLSAPADRLAILERLRMSPQIYRPRAALVEHPEIPE